MAQILSSGAVGPLSERKGWSVATALRLAWGAWSVLLVIPFLLFLACVWDLGVLNHGVASGRSSHAWFLVMCAYMLVVVPGSFFWRGEIIKAYWKGVPVSPQRYFWGMLCSWLALEIGGILSIVGCFVDGAILPNLLPALVAFMFYVTLWPTGRAMVSGKGNKHDAQFYEEPR